MSPSSSSLLKSELGDLPLAEDVPLAPHTSFHIGGPARWFVEAEDVSGLGRAIDAARRAGTPVLVLGGGTNLLVSDEGFDGLVVKLAIAGARIDRERGEIRVGAAEDSSAVVEAAVEAGLGGLEFAAGLPGSVGGALAGNAGCFGRSFGDVLRSATLVQSDGGVCTVDDPAWFRFDYRSTSLGARGAVIAEAVIAVEPVDIGRLRDASAEHLALRAQKHPPRDARTAGSYFRNLPPAEPGGRRRAAGALLDQVGAKQMRVGDAAVFERHANIVVNRGRATARDVLDLTAQMADAVEARFGVRLEPEVRYVGARPGGAA